MHHYIANIINSIKYNDSALMVLTPLQRNTRHFCETYSTLYIIYRTYSISLKKMIISCIGSPCLHIQLLGAGYPTLTPVEGEVRFFHALGPAGPFAKRHEQQNFNTQKNITTISLHVKSTRTAQAFAPAHRVLTHFFLKYVGRTKLFLSMLTLTKSDY